MKISALLKTFIIVINIYYVTNTVSAKTLEFRSVSRNDDDNDDDDDEFMEAWKRQLETDPIFPVSSPSPAEARFLMRNSAESESGIISLLEKILPSKVMFVITNLIFLIKMLFFSSPAMLMSPQTAIMMKLIKTAGTPLLKKGMNMLSNSLTAKNQSSNNSTQVGNRKLEDYEELPENEYWRPDPLNNYY